MKIRITACDLGVKQKSTNSINLERGRKDYTLYFFKSAVLINTKLGLHEASPGDCLLISPGFPHHIKSKGLEWCYDSLSFKGSDASRLISQIPFETNKGLDIKYRIQSILERRIFFQFATSSTPDSRPN